MRLFQRVGGAALLAVVIGAMFVGQPAMLSAQTSGFTIDYQDSWPLNSRMKFVRAVIKPNAGTSPRDLDFHIVAQSEDYRASGFVVSTVIPIRKGDVSASGELYIPVSSNSQFTLHAELDGDKRYSSNDFAKRNYYEYYSGNVSSDGFSPPFLYASSDVIADESTQFNVLNRGTVSRVPRNISLATKKKSRSVSDIESWYPKTTNYGSDRNFITFNELSSPFTGAMSLDALPSKWFGYEGLGFVMISCNDLALLAKTHPGKLLALERWVAASGKLVVLNCGKNLSRVHEPLKLLGDTDARLRDNRNCVYPAKPLADKTKLRNLRSNSQNSMANGQGFDSWNLIPDLNLTAQPLKKVVGSGKAKDMVSIEFEQGAVICVSDAASNFGKEKDDVDRWGQVAIFINGATNDSPRFLLQGVTNQSFGFPEFEEPPRYIFEFSILFYLIAVGPGAFYILKRRNKLNLMFVIVPIISLLFCSSILAWAIFAEGFDTRVNLFTLTELNQATGRQTTSSLSHVYSGMTPSPYRFGGATFGFVNTSSNNGRQNRIEWGPQGQEVSGGEIRARTNHQLTTNCSNETKQKLDFSFKGSGDEAAVTVQNGFESKMECVVFRSKDCGRGEVWFCESIDPGATVSAKKLTLTKAAESIRIMVREKGKGISLAKKSNRSRSRNSRSYGYNYYGNNSYYSGNHTATETVGSAIKSMWLLGESKLKTALKNDKSFIAISEHATNFDSDLAIENAVFECEIHVIKGVRQ